LRELENKVTPRQQTWEVLLGQTKVPGIHFEDHPELSAFECPEYSHLKPDDVPVFTQRLIPYLKVSLGL
jgi:hypothetical protein